MMATNQSEITPHIDLPQSDETFVASGSTCVCFRVRQHGRLLLKKQLLPALASDVRRRQALKKEFEIGFNLDHPNIPRYIEFHGDSLLMEYVDGMTLTAFQKQHLDFFKEKRYVRQFADELCSAVAYLHQHQVLHLDLKPDNIMMTRIGNHVKLIDLGYCYQDGFPFSTGGTPGYAAPEDVKTPASDIYSLGCIFSELGIASEAVISKCLNAEAAKRYQSIDELTNAMRKKRIPWMTLVSLFLVLLFVVVGWWLMGRKNTTATDAVTKTVQEKSSENVVPKDTLSDIDLASSAKPVEMEQERQQISSDNADASAVTVIDKGEAPKKEEIYEDPVLSNQKKTLPLFKHVTDSILADLKQFVANDRMPYQLGSLEAYKAAYDSLKSAALRCGTKGENIPFWMRMIWTKYNGKPKPYDLHEDYLFQQLATIESLFQTHATNYNLNNKK